MTDEELLRQYVREGHHPALATLVGRHLDLVYSVARRHLPSSAQAEDVAQSVFIELARHARRIKPGTPLIAWLHLVSRRMAINTARGERRRQSREITAVELAAMKPDSSAWDTIEPLLDEAVETLNAADRSAILLRFFENKSLREVGEALGFSEDAAQKRVTRALEQLRAQLVRRGVAVTAAGLATDLSAHAIHIAPVTLAPAIATGTAALSAATFQATAVEAAKTLAMTTLQKSVVGAALVLAIGAGVYEATLFARQESELSAVQQRTAGLEAELQSARARQAIDAQKLKSVEARIDTRIADATTKLSSGDAALEAQMKTWLANLDRLRDLAAHRPGLRIPELQLLSDENWFTTAAQAKLGTESDIRETFAQLRHEAENMLVERMRRALGAYVKTNGGMLPGSVSQLLPFLESPVEASWLDRYEMLQSGKLSDVSTPNYMAVVGLKAPIDAEYDSTWKFGVNGFMTSRALREDIVAASSAFAAANNGQAATTATQIIPYLKWPVSEAAVQRNFIPPSTKTTR